MKQKMLIFFLAVIAPFLVPSQTTADETEWKQAATLYVKEHFPNREILNRAHVGRAAASPGVMQETYVFLLSDDSGRFSVRVHVRFDIDTKKLLSVHARRIGTPNGEYQNKK